MSNSRLIIDLVVESDEDLQGKLGHDVDTGAGWVDVQATGSQPGAEIVTVSLEGPLPAILQWMINEWQDDDLALEEFVRAAQDGRIEPM